MKTGADWRITWAVEYMQRHLAGPLAVSELARRVDLSSSRFRDLFSAQMGMGPVQYLQQLRLRRARLLIERTFLTVKEVTAIVGYNDASQFSRDFRREHGVAPSTLRGRGLTTALPPAPPSSVEPPVVRRKRQRRAREPGPAAQKVEAKAVAPIEASDGTCQLQKLAIDLTGELVASGVLMSVVTDTVAAPASIDLLTRMRNILN